MGGRKGGRRPKGGDDGQGGSRRGKKKGGHGGGGKDQGPTLKEAQRLEQKAEKAKKMAASKKDDLTPVKEEMLMEHRPKGRVHAVPEGESDSQKDRQTMREQHSLLEC